MTVPTTVGANRAERRLSLWRLERLRLVRTGRLVALVAVFAFFGATAAPMNRYMAEILQRVGGDIQIVAPTPTATSSFGSYSSNAMQIGMLVFVLVVASAVAVDGHTEMAIFLRSRVTSQRTLIEPRYVVSVAAGVLAYLLGVAACWWGTSLLLGAVDPAAVAIGAASGAIYLIFVGSLVTAVANVVRSVIGTAVLALGIALGLGVLGAVTPFGDWLPSHLPGALAGAVGGAGGTAYLGAGAVTAASIAGLLVLAAALGRRREL
jgi:ABC-2 type transport system permease protein